MQKHTTTTERGGELTIATKAWGCTFFCSEGKPTTQVPFEAVHWTIAFRNWIDHRWFDSTHPMAAYHRSFQGANAFDPQLKPLFEVGRAGGVFELDDPLTFSYFFDYLHEVPERQREWNRFIKNHGQPSELGW